MELHQIDVACCRDAHQQLATVAQQLSDFDVGQPSLLPGWTVGHVVTHLARNADAMVRRIEAAQRGEVVEQYVGGVAGRAAEIESGAKRAAADLFADVVASSAQLDDVFASLDGDDWARPVRTLAGGEHPVSDLPFHRWFEVEIHSVDLHCGFEPGDWSERLVQRVLPRLVRGLAARADQRVLMAWLLGRGPAPELTPWR